MKMPKKESATILIVDDERIILNIIEEQISFFGYQPIIASSGEEALHAAEKQVRIDLLLTDIMMPGMNGVDLARQFAVLYPETRILFMSGDISPFIDGQEIPDSEHFFVQKPFGVETLISKIRNILSEPAALPIDLFDS
jgi:CheY-like chemotaxis protein